MNRRGILAGIIAFSLMTGTAAFAADTAPAAPTSPAAEVAPAPAVAAGAPVLAAAPGATPLAPRPTKPLTLAPKDEGTPFGYKLLAGLGLAAAAGLWLHKKKKDAGGEKKKPASRIDILSRQSVGVRNELLVVDVEGTRLLVGMTPGAMQTLAVLETPEPLTEISDDVKETAAQRPVTERIAQPAAARAAYDAHQDEHDEEEEDELPPVSFVPSKPRATTSVSALDQKVRSLLANRSPQPQSTQSSVVPKRRRGNNPSKTARIAGQAKGLLLAMSDDAETPARTGEM